MAGNFDLAAFYGRMKIVLATRNPGKVRELRRLLEALPVTLVSLDEVDQPPVVEEDQPGLAGNARKKALALHRHTGLPALADDTGLEVDALGGGPGVRSARYAGDDADDEANRRLLLDEMSQVADRSARFRTVIALAEGSGVSFFEGVCDGRILERERGEGGFGYDPVFAPDGSERSFAEMSAEEKNRVSHRGVAMREFAESLRGRLEQTQ